MIVTTIDKMPQCDGACEAHTGTPRMVFVQGWGKFRYCDAAVKEDERRGLVVSDFVEDDAHQKSICTSQSEAMLPDNAMYPAKPAK